MHAAAMEHTLRRVLWVVVLVSVEAAGEFMMPAIFKDGVVLQHTAANVFGFADPGQKVTVDVTDEKTTTTTTYTAVADTKTGRWTVRVAPCADPKGEVTISAAVVSSGQGVAPPKITFGRVTFGEVFLCSGQSNMVMSVAAATSGGIYASDPAILQRTWPTIRLFDTVSTLNHPPWAVNKSEPQRDLWPYVNQTSTLCGWGRVEGQENKVNPDIHVCQSWQVASPGVTDSFSAECFFAAVSLVESGAIPDGRNVGLVLSAYSGTSMETWTPPEAFVGCPNKTKSDSTAGVTSSATWLSADMRTTSSQWVLPDADSCLWNSMINPLVGFGIRAALWNQGESNMGDTFERYSCVFKNMITAWRSHWGIGDFPFIATQIGDQGGNWPSYVAEPRDAQLSILRTLANTGVVSAYDQGDHCGGGKCDGPCIWRQHSGNTCDNVTHQCCTNPFGFFGVHSRFKQEIGRRAALVLTALCNFSSSRVDWDGPVPTSAVANPADGSITISWSLSASGAAEWERGEALYLNGTRDCWECCTTTGGGAKDVFQVSTKFPQANGNERSQQWVNTTFLFDSSLNTVKLMPVTPAPAKESYVVVRYAASLWPQCAIYKASNNVPAFSFSDLNITR